MANHWPSGINWMKCFISHWLLTIKPLRGVKSLPNPSSPGEKVMCLAEDANPSEEPAAASIIALGSQDGRLTIWRVDRDRPILVANRVFKHTVVDLAWTQDGYHLIACSMDGTVASFHFDLGTSPPASLTGLLPGSNRTSETSWDQLEGMQEPVQESNVKEIQTRGLTVFEYARAASAGLS